MFAFFFDLCRPVLENANVKCEHYHFLERINIFLMFDENANADVTREQCLTATTFGAVESRAFYK